MSLVKKFVCNFNLDKCWLFMFGEQLRILGYCYWNGSSSTKLHFLPLLMIQGRRFSIWANVFGEKVIAPVKAVLPPRFDLIKNGVSSFLKSTGHLSCSSSYLSLSRLLVENNLTDRHFVDTDLSTNQLLRQP
jgi:hypothetical protein